MGNLRNFRVVVNDQVYQVEVEEVGEGHPNTAPQGQAEPRQREATGHEARAATPEPGTTAGTAPAGGEQIVAPLPGVVLEVRVVEGEQVEAGQVLLLLEAMKMENEVVAPCPGKVTGIRVEAGTVVNVGDPLLVLAP